MAQTLTGPASAELFWKNYSRLRATVKAFPNRHSLADAFSTPATKTLPLADYQGEKKKKKRKECHCSHDLQSTLCFLVPHEQVFAVQY